MFQIIGILLCILVICVIWQVQELMRFNRTTYQICSDKLKGEHKWVVLADLHLWRYGRHNERLVQAIREESPEAIFVPGDLIVQTKPELFYVTEELMEQLTAIAPVYFSNGNHESRLEDPEHKNHASYQQLKMRMTELGVHILNNEREIVKAGEDELVILGLELPLPYYKKGVDTPLAPGELSRCLGRPDVSRYQILLAHTPKYVPEYFAWGADLSLSGHYHGGLVCIPGIGSVISPQFELFPKHSFGRFDEGGQTALVSRGMGTHTFHIRIFNRSELLVVTAKPEKPHVP
ncbi:MAG: metallophosphoesterase [Eubacterium sp.]|nr:metallophosphoesterase [Eubacterium sp.]